MQTGILFSKSQLKEKKKYIYIYWYLLPWGCSCLFTSDWIQPIHADKGSVVQVQSQAEPHQSGLSTLLQFCFLIFLVWFFVWHLKSFFFFFAIHSCMAALLARPSCCYKPPPRGPGLFRSNACRPLWSSFVLQDNKRYFWNDSLLWFVFVRTICIKALWCDGWVSRILPHVNTREADKGWVMKPTQKRHTIIDEKKLITVRAYY